MLVAVFGLARLLPKFTKNTYTMTLKLVNIDVGTGGGGGGTEGTCPQDFAINKEMLFQFLENTAPRSIVPPKSEILLMSLLVNMLKQLDQSHSLSVSEFLAYFRSFHMVKNMS